MHVIRIIRGLYAIADTLYLDETRLTRAVEQALRGGARVIQYRDKTLSPGQRMKHAAALRSACTAHRACFIVNDDIELARGASADGVHLGRHDAAIDVARDLLGADALIGVSCYNDLARAERAVAGGANYVAFGGFFPSPTKPDAVRAEPMLLHAARTRLNVPLVAIGGITPENGAALIAAGADALAVISGVFDQPDVESAARRYTLLFQEREQS
jgi:thiamine-phosphate pyrophosphorylase